MSWVTSLGKYDGQRSSARRILSYLPRGAKGGEVGRASTKRQKRYEGGAGSDHAHMVDVA